MDTPKALNLGSGKNFRQDCINVDVDPGWSPDVVADLSAPFPGETRMFETRRFGALRIEPDAFESILALDVLEHVADLPTFMHNCLGLLHVDGVLTALVPYDLGFGAWQDPTHVRAFNERSWRYYTEWFWYLGWTEARFELEELRFNLSDLGRRLEAEGVDQAVILRTPRAVDSMLVELRKVALTDADRRALAAHVPPRERAVSMAR